jgi:hypothetical protein
VLIDRSHNWFFAYDDLADRILPPHGWQAVLSDASLDTVAKVRDFDVLFVGQWKSKVAFSPAEVQLLRRYVEEGGALFLVGRPDLPIAAVAEAFGLHMRLHQGKPPLRVAERLVKDHGAEATVAPRAASYSVVPTPGIESLLADMSGTPVAATRPFGKGRVLLFADGGQYWDFAAQRDAQMNVPHQPTTVALFRSLAPRFITASPAPAHATRITGELQQKVGNFKLVFSQPLAVHAGEYGKLLLRISPWIAEANGGLPPVQETMVNLLAGGGGGWAGPAAIGIGCDGNLDYNVRVIAHELTHIWSPLRGAFGEGWASFLGLRVGERLGYAEAANRERQQRWKRLDQVDPKRNALDVAGSSRSGGDLQHFRDCVTKTMWMMEQLEQRFGKDLMSRVMEVRHAVKEHGETVTEHEVLYYFMLASGADLSSWYHQLGIVYQPPPPISPAQLRERLAAHRERVKRWSQDHPR